MKQTTMEVHDVVELVWENNCVTALNHSRNQRNESEMKTESNNDNFGMWKSGSVDDRRGIGLTGGFGSRSIKRSRRSCDEEHEGFANHCDHQEEGYASSFSEESSDEARSSSENYEEESGKMMKFCTKRKRYQLSRNLRDEEVDDKLKMLHALVPNRQQRVGKASMLNQVIRHIKTLQAELQVMTKSMQETAAFALSGFSNPPVIGEVPDAYLLLPALATAPPDLIPFPSFFSADPRSAPDLQPELLTYFPVIHIPVASSHPAFPGVSTPPYIGESPFPPAQVQQPSPDLLFLSSQGGSALEFHPPMPHSSFPYPAGIPLLNGLCSPSFLNAIVLRNSVTN